MEFVAALRGTFDDQKPSLFELLTEQQLSSLLPPTLRYVLTVVTQRYPRYLLRVLNSFDELHALCMLIVERHYLKTRGGSFTENFYGLKREKALYTEIPRARAEAPVTTKEALALSRTDVWKNLAVLVALPYLKRKLDEAYRINAPRALLGVAYTRLPTNPSMKQRFLHYYRWFLRNIYPSVNAAYYFSLLIFNLAYLFDNSKYHDPFMWLIGTRVRRMTAADHRTIDMLSRKAAKGANPGARSFFDPRALGSNVLSSLSLMLPLSIFALNFLEWWHASDFARQVSRKAAENLELPPPIISGLADLTAGQMRDEKHQDADEGTSSEGGEVSSPKNPPIALPSLLPIHTVVSPADSSLCPICEKEVTTATACPTGLVYCYSCIHRWIEGTHPRQERFMSGKAGKWESGIGRCAVTGKRILGGTGALRRIMV